MAVTQSNDSPTKNYAVMSPLHPNTGTFSKGNLTAVTDGTDGAQPVGSIAFNSEDSSGYYFIMRPTTTSSSIGAFAVGVATVAHANERPTNDATNAGSWFFNCGNGNVTNTSAIANGTWDSGGNGGMSLNQYVQVAVKAGKIYFGVNNTWYDSSDGTFANAGHAFDNLTGFVVPMFQHAHASAGTVEVQFGETTFTYAAPTGYKEITAANLYSSAAPAIEDGSAHFQTILWSGNSSSQTATQTGNSGFTPDWAIIKSRSFGNGANSFDSVRGGSKGLATFDSGVEDDQGDGVTFGISSDKGTLAFTGAGDTGDINASGRTYVGWTWLAGGAPTTDNISNGGSPGQTPTNNSVFRDGAASTTAFGSASIYPTRASINTTAGLSIVEYIGTGSNATLAHGLGAVPKMAWFRNRESAGNNWVVYHAGTGNTHHTNLDNTNAQTAGDRFQDTDPTNEVFSVDGTTDINKSTDEHVAYIFAEVPGFSRFGFFEGNGSSANGPFIELGFKPAWFMWKNVDSSTNGNWTVMDSGRDPFNMVENNLRMDTADAQDTGEADLDFLSNGVRHRGGTSERFNTDNQTYLYAAFAEHPFAGSTPATAR